MVQTKRGYANNIDATAVPLAHGGIENGTAKSKQNRDWFECDIELWNASENCKVN